MSSSSTPRRPRRRSRGWAAVASTLAACALLVVRSPPGVATSSSRCRATPFPAALARVARAALASPTDILGQRLLATPGGPTAAAAATLLPPLFFARGAHRGALTASGAYYVPSAPPAGPLGTSEVALALADGSGIAFDRVGGRGLTIGVGVGGAEPFGSCLERLAPARLARGYLPILETGYRDGVGARYTEEAFAARVARLGGLVAFITVGVDTRGATAPVALRFALRDGAEGARDGRVLHGGATVALFTPGATATASALTYRLAPDTTTRIDVAVLARPVPAGTLPPLAALAATARAGLGAAWQHRLDAGASVEVPDREADDAERALLIQELTLGYRYSVGNAYQEFSFPESIDVARVLGEWGFASAERAILALSFDRPPTPYPNWTRGEKLLGVGSYLDLVDDPGFLARATPTLRGYLETIAHELSPRLGLLPRERYSSDVDLRVYSLPGQSVVWQGLEAIARAWARAGDGALAARSERLARWLRAGLLHAVARSQVATASGLFVPAMLDAGERPYTALTRSRLGSYWNLVIPYALASGIFPPGGGRARAILRYLASHGALLLGLVRAGAFALYGRHAAPPNSGTDEVYGTNLVRFLAANGRADELDLALAGELADAFTPRTFVSGEAASVSPLDGLGERAMYLPPNSAANASFLETLRLTLVNEATRPDGAPDGLELAAATPRRWLTPGNTITVRRLPTSYGPLSFTLAARGHRILATVSLPPRRSPRTVLTLRLPRGERLERVELDGRPDRRVDAKRGTVDLSGLRGTLRLVAEVS